MVAEMQPVFPRAASRSVRSYRTSAVSCLVLLAGSLMILESTGSVSSSVFTAPAPSDSALRLRPSGGLQRIAGSAVTMNAFKVPKQRRPWSEPVPPEEVVAEARERGYRLRPAYNQEKFGYVVSDKNRKTRVCLVEYFLFHTTLGVWYKQSKKKHFHDEYEISKVGDAVLIAPWEKMSSKKSHRLVEVVRSNSGPVRV
mmetsp:Transcript_34347/g.78263  ORF Transcript_34347/g.78263 Transcript_34347/m.78263 type:complete len:198 (-) Transcript_34347:34-627(-)